MNRDIIELREVVQKLVPLLSGKGLTVTQRGSQAYVTTNPHTKRPETVNIPNIADNAQPDFIRAIQGFIDHEVAHVLYTDWNYYGRGASAADLRKPEVQQFMNTHNIVEDTFIERRIVEDFPGSESNISDTRKYFLERITAKALKDAKNEKEAFRYLLVPVMRALAGHEEMQEFMDKGDYWKNKYVQGVVDGLKPATIDLLKTCRSTKETLEISEELHVILYPPKSATPPAPPKAAPPPPPPPPPAKPKEEEPEEDEDESEDESEDEDDKKEAGEGDGDEERDHDETDDDGEGDASDPDKDEDGEEDEGDDEDGEPGDDEDAEPGDDDGDEEDEDSSGADADEEDDAEMPGAGSDDDDDESDEEEDESTPAGMSGGTDAEESDEDGEGDSKLPSGKSPFRTEGADGGGVGDIDVDVDDDPHEGTGGGVGNEAAKSIFDFDQDAFKEADMSSQIAILISDEAVLAMDPKQYLVFTRERDRIEHVEPPAKMDDAWVPKMEDEVRSMTGKMQKDIERIMASQSHVIRTPGHRRGKLHAPSLYRIQNGDPRVFTQKEEHKSKDTAVSLLCDNSGSMGGQKMKLAMISAYALSLTLDRVQITHEVLGFTSGGYYDVPQTIREAMQAEAVKAKINWDRIEPIIMPIYKEFEERMSATVKARFAYMMFAQYGLNGNIDGESLEYAAERLLKRPERRKVMMVLSDGQPAGSHKSGPHLSYVVRQLEKMGIECIGIGIMDRSVARYYPKHVVLNNLDDLPGQVMGEIKRILA